MSNLGQLDNRGVELTINAVPAQNARFKWNTDFTFSLNRNKIVHLYGDMVDVVDANGKVTGQREVDDPTNGRYIGHALDEIYGYQVIGVWQVSEKRRPLNMAAFRAIIKRMIRIATVNWNRWTMYGKATPNRASGSV
jgi:hypothetical protein